MDRRPVLLKIPEHCIEQITNEVLEITIRDGVIPKPTEAESWEGITRMEIRQQMRGLNLLLEASDCASYLVVDFEPGERTMRHLTDFITRHIATPLRRMQKLASCPITFVQRLCSDAQRLVSLPDESKEQAIARDNLSGTIRMLEQTGFLPPLETEGD